MDIAAIETFVTVARNQNIHKAAKELHISQPAVTARIHLLEARVGSKLIEKAGRNIRLTDAGKVLYPYFIHSLSILNLGIAAIHKEDIHNRRDCLTIAADECSMYWLAQLVSYINQHMNSRFEYRVIEIPFVRLYEDLIFGNVQLAVTSKEYYHPQLRTLSLCNEQAVCVVHSRLLSGRQAAPLPLPLILNRKDPFFPNLQSQMLHKEFPAFFSSVVYVEHQSALQRLIETGAGCGFLPKSVAECGVRSGQFLILSTPQFAHLTYPQYLVYSTDLSVDIQQSIVSFLLEYDLDVEPS